MTTQAEALQAILRLRSQDPAFHYKPGPTALKFHQSNAPYRLITGGGQSGKSNSATMEVAMLLRGIHPYKKWFGPVTALCLAATRQQAAMVMQDKFFNRCGWPDLPGNPPGLGNFPLIPPYELAKVTSITSGVKATYHATLTNDSQMYFSWSGSEKVMEIIQGPSPDIIYLDENVGSREMLIEIYKRFMARHNLKNWSGTLIWSATGTMMEAAFEEFRNRCIDPDDKDHAYFQIAPGENPAQTKEGVDRVAAILTPEERKIHITGESTRSALVSIYGKQFDDKRHMAIPDYEVQPSDNLWLAYDPGVDHPTGIVIAAINEQFPLTLNFVKCWKHRYQTIDFDLKVIDQWLCGRRLAGFIYDTATENRSKAGMVSVASILIDAMIQMGITPITGFHRSIKNHWRGITMMRHYLDPDPYNKTIRPLIRINASKESGGQDLRYEIMKYRGREETRFTGEGGVVKKDDDLIDPARYLCAKRPAYNPEWSCGTPTRVVTDPAMPPAPIPPPEPASPLSNYERQLMRSRDRTRTKTGGTGSMTNL